MAVASKVSKFGDHSCLNLTSREASKGGRGPLDVARFDLPGSVGHEEQGDFDAVSQARRAEASLTPASPGPLIFSSSSMALTKV